jgi:hypothetical protein
MAQRIMLTCLAEMEVKDLCALKIAGLVEEG